MAKARKKASKKAQPAQDRQPKRQCAACREGQDPAEETAEGRNSTSAITTRPTSTRACAPTPNTATSACHWRPAAWYRRMSSASFRHSSRRRCRRRISRRGSADDLRAQGAGTRPSSRAKACIPPSARARAGCSRRASSTPCSAIPTTANCWRSCCRRNSIR